jgi:hypothetical protein
MIYEVTTEGGWLEPGWYVLGWECLGPCDTESEARERLDNPPGSDDPTGSV